MNCPTCKTELSQHQVSRCMDAWVAEKIMGWSYYKSKDDIWIVRAPWGQSFEGEYYNKYDPATGKKLPQPDWFKDCEDIPYWGSNMTDAMDVWRKIAEIANVEKIGLQYVVADESYTAHVSLVNTLTQHAVADSPALAICKVALWVADVVKIEMVI